MGSPEFFYIAEINFVYGQRASCSIQIDGPDLQDLRWIILRGCGMRSAV